MSVMLAATSSPTVSDVVNSTAEVVEKVNANDAIVSNAPIIRLAFGIAVLVIVCVVVCVGLKNRKRALDIEDKKLKMKK